MPSIKDMNGPELYLHEKILAEEGVIEYTDECHKRQLDKEKRLAELVKESKLKIKEIKQEHSQKAKGLPCELDALLKKVRDLLQNNVSEHCVGVNVFFNSEGYTVEYTLRSPGSLKRAGISMRNLKGDFIFDV